MTFIDPISAVGADPVQPLAPGSAPAPSDPAAAANATVQADNANPALDTTTVVDNADGTVTTTTKDASGDILSVITTGLPTIPTPGTGPASETGAASETASRLNITI